ncbi:hypothetical protein Rsub_04264 [Raphidocelis subcapitata]|uniref:Uncharacterized protein n=1 Tax=Raphidocelis subcapitata TaxID=307507 RepID=A0A2V0NV60_9CHLO|nr:hypothetical protein Rsub_04264 [Raphidocelis subcapitata]|eukprot:GBF91524.1 hypothetical protein Rsub_04264 [Raphidocelis subcapitata]
MAAEAVSRRLGGMAASQPLDAVLRELAWLRSGSGLFDPEAFLAGFGAAAERLTESQRLSAAAALRAAGVAPADRLLLAACGDGASAAAGALQRGMAGGGALERDAQQLFVALLRAAAAAAAAADSAAAAADGGEADSTAGAAQIVGLVEAACDEDQELHACAFRAVASLLQPLDERLAHAWMLREVNLLLAPCSSSSGGGGEGEPSASGNSGRGSPDWLHAAGLGAAGARAHGRSGAWRGKSWWQAALPAVLVCIEPDELLAALGARLPAAGRTLAAQRAVAGLTAALLQRTVKAARNTIERLSGCIVAALATDDMPALHSLLLICRRVLSPEDYASLLASAFGQHRAAASAAAAAEPGAPAGAAAAAAAQCYCRLAAALRAVNAGAPRGVLAAHVDLLNGLASDWRVADQEAVRNAKNDLLPLIKACMQEQAAAVGGDGSLAKLDPAARRLAEAELLRQLQQFRDAGASKLPEQQVRAVLFNRPAFEQVTLPLLLAAPDSLEQAELRQRYLKACAAEPRIRSALPKDAVARYAATCDAAGFDLEGPVVAAVPGGMVATAAAVGDTPVGRLQQLLDRLPVVASKAGAADSFARLLERTERQLREVVALYERRQPPPPQQQQQLGQQQQPSGSGGPLRAVGGNAVPPGPAGAPRDAKRLRVADGSGNGRGGGSGAGSGGAGGGVSAEVLVEWLLHKYLQAEDKAAAAAAAAAAAPVAAAAEAGGAPTAAPPDPSAWRVAFARMLQGVPALHGALVEALAAVAECPPGGDTRKAAATAGLLACMAACEPALEAVADGGTRDASSGGGGGGGGGGEGVELVPTARPRFVWRCCLRAGQEECSCDGRGGGGCRTSQRLHGEGVLQELTPKLPPAAWPSGSVPVVPMAAGRMAGTAGSPSQAAGGGGAGGGVPGCALCLAVLRRCRLSSWARLASAAGFWASYLERAASAGWWCTAGAGEGLSEVMPASVRLRGTQPRKRPPRAAAVAFVPPELPGFLAWLERRLPACEGGEGAAAAVAAAQKACRTALEGSICQRLLAERRARRGGAGGEAEAALQWEAKALSDGLPLPPSVLRDAAAAVVQGLGFGAAPLPPGGSVGGA